MCAVGMLRRMRQAMHQWDRGYDKDNKPVWGPDQGPYVFRKASE